MQPSPVAFPWAQVLRSTPTQTTTQFPPRGACFPINQYQPAAVSVNTTWKEPFLSEIPLSALSINLRICIFYSTDNFKRLHYIPPLCNFAQLPKIKTENKWKQVQLKTSNLHILEKRTWRLHSPPCAISWRSLRQQFCQGFHLYKLVNFYRFLQSKTLIKDILRNLAFDSIRWAPARL